MRLVCPCCGAACAAEAWENDEQTRVVFAAILGLPPAVGALCLRYLALFRPRPVDGKAKALAWARCLTIVQQLRDAVAAGHVQFDGKPARPAPPGLWAQAISQMLECPPQRLPLKSHGYLRAIVYDLADAADKQAEKQRRVLENSGGLRRPAGPTGGDLEPLMSLEQMRAIRRQRLGRLPGEK